SGYQVETRWIRTGRDLRDRVECAGQANTGNVKQTKSLYIITSFVHGAIPDRGSSRGAP
ncbi:hypothetical protein Bpfe_006170, partial [Biomphalaria pfeifferi]